MRNGRCRSFSARKVIFVLRSRRAGELPRSFRQACLRSFLRINRSCNAGPRDQRYFCRNGTREISRDNNNIPIRCDMWHSGSPRASRPQLDHHENSIIDQRGATIPFFFQGISGKASRRNFPLGDADELRRRGNGHLSRNSIALEKQADPLVTRSRHGCPMAQSASSCRHRPSPKRHQRVSVMATPSARGTR